MLNVDPPTRLREQKKPGKPQKMLRRPDPDNPVDPAFELIEDNGLTWEQRVEIEARGRFVRKLRGRE
jgi:hypothetical protein